MPILVWTNINPDAVDEYADADSVQEYGAGHLRVWSTDGRRVIAHYAPGEWKKTLHPDWPVTGPRPWCICTSPEGRLSDDSGTIPLPIDIPGLRRVSRDAAA